MQLLNHCMQMSPSKYQNPHNCPPEANKVDNYGVLQFDLNHACNAGGRGTGLTIKVHQRSTLSYLLWVSAQIFTQWSSHAQAKAVQLQASRVQYSQCRTQVYKDPASHDEARAGVFRLQRHGSS